MDFVYDPANAARIAAYVQYISPVQGVQDELRKMGGDDAALADNQLHVPGRRRRWRTCSRGATWTRTRKRSSTRSSPGSPGPERTWPPRPSTATTRGLRKGRFAPYGLLSPGIIWLLLFFLVPVMILAGHRCRRRRAGSSTPSSPGSSRTYATAFQDYGTEFVRSFIYAGIATVLAILIGYPLAYWIVTQGGRWRNLLIGLVVVPFFTSYLIRTIAWAALLQDDGALNSFLVSLPAIPSDFS